MDDVLIHLGSHEFRTLFVERLGWDRASGRLEALADGTTYGFEVIAHKRGFQVLHCVADRYTLFNRRRLRTLQKQLLKLAHEHIVIYSCEEPRKQVWQWAVRLQDRRRLRHREHPFFSASPPAPLVERLRNLRFTLAEEEQITLVDALQRVRAALDTTADQDLFVNRPWYAEQSDRLALAMQCGGTNEFHEFVLFHRPLAKWGAKRLRRWFGMDEEDAEQIGMIAVLRAAKRFKPELGFQFSTYATRAIHRDCHRTGPDGALLIRVPAPVYWSYVRLRRAADRLDAHRGPGAGRRFLTRLAERDAGIRSLLPKLRAATEVRFYSDPRDPEYWSVRQVPDPGPDPATALAEGSMTGEVLHSAIDALPPDDATIIRLRYGLEGGKAQTLEAVGRLFNVTKERIRQRQRRIERLLRSNIHQALGEPPEPATESKPDSSSEASPTPDSVADGPDPDIPDRTSVQPREQPPEIFILTPQRRLTQQQLFANAN